MKANPLKLLIFPVLTVMALNPAWAAKKPEKKLYKARPNYYAAASPADLNRLAQYELRGDQAAIQRMVKNKQLIVLGKNDEYAKDLSTPYLGQVMRVKSKDGRKTYWTTKDAFVGGDR